MSSGFLRCNQCIKTLHLSYQTAQSDDFKFFTWYGGDPYGKGGSEHYAKEKDRSKMVFKVIFLDPRVFPIQINIRLKKIQTWFFLHNHIGAALPALRKPRPSLLFYLD